MESCILHDAHARAPSSVFVLLSGIADGLLYLAVWPRGMASGNSMQKLTAMPFNACMHECLLHASEATAFHDLMRMVSCHLAGDATS